MPKEEGGGFLSLDKFEDQMLIGTFICIFLSLYFGMQPGLIMGILWAAVGIVAIICMYFAFPHTWPYGLLLYAAYALSAFGIILPMFWYDKIKVVGISLPIIAGIFFILAAFYIVYHIIQYVKRTRDAIATEDRYLPLGFWSIGVILFVVFTMLSIFSWALWVDSGGGVIGFYVVFEIFIAFLLVYILWLPDRQLDWAKEELPQSPASKFMKDRTKVIRDKVVPGKKICPECGKRLEQEKKFCPSCNKVQTFGWCATSEGYVLPCSQCGVMNMYGKKTCIECGKALSEEVACSSCDKTFPIKDWVVKKA